MPILEITPAMVGPDRTRLALNYIESMMLWQDDEAQRAEAMRTGTATFIRDSISAVPAAQREVEASRWVDWYALLADAFPLKHIQEQAKKPFVHGLIAGEILAAAVLRYEIDGSIKLESLKHQMIGTPDIPGILPKRAKTSPWFVISRSTLENTIWPKFKPVSHLWASYWFSSIVEADHTFPCALQRLPQFLSIANFFMLSGSKISLPRRGHQKLVEPDIMWRIPSDIVLPRFAPRFEQLRARR